MTAVLVSEMFASIQGEGVSAGVPSVFVRVAECPLRCTWCDTKYTWDWANHDRAREVTEMPVDAVAARVRELAGDGIENLVLTGGEPMLQQDDLRALCVRLPAMRVEVETAGVIEPRADFAAEVDQWNVSPKLASSGNKTSARLRAGPLAWFAAAPNAYWKWVATREDDLREIDELVRTWKLPRERVTVMPEGTDAATLQDRARWLVPACQTRGYRFGTRLHVLLWGAERGK